MKFNILDSKPMVHDPGSECGDCGMPGDLCTCDAMDQCEGDYCKDLDED
jgi:hypothetical protein